MTDVSDVDKQNLIDARLGFVRYQEGPEKLGWLVNMQATSVLGADKKTVRSAVDLYFLQDDGEYFKCTFMYNPYFYVMCKPGTEADVDEYVRRRFEKTIVNVHKVKKVDLNQPNHLAEPPRVLLKLEFLNVQDLLTVRRSLDPIVKRNREKSQVIDTYTDMLSHRSNPVGSRIVDPADCILDLREYDVPYYVRVAIDQNIRVGLWYEVKVLTAGEVQIKNRPDLVKRAEPVVLAFDIETTKLPLKFPDASIDMIMMISYMIDGQGYLITNREIVSQDIEDFEYTPKPEYEGPFIIFNEKNEKALLRRFFEHIQEAKPTVVATYNGDLFDWPFVEARSVVHGFDIYQETGFYKDNQNEYKSKSAIHMDCFRWVKRDSYLPAGSHGLKAVTTAKLGYNPMELDPEDMTPFANEQPQTLAQYSVSDAVATYYLYMKYVHPFIFSLCNVIPLIGDEVLRKGSGTLCEMLLMVEAYDGNILMPNKHQEPYGKMYEGHLIESETYVGGHVEALEAGVFRSDIPEQFKIVPSAIQQLIDQVDAALQFSIVTEANQALENVTNYDEVKDAIVSQLKQLLAAPNHTATPLIYHLDVAAMYPNIILTYRLQPDAIIDESACARCDYNVPGKTCDRRMTWAWRGEYYPAKRNEYNMIRAQLESERFPSKDGMRRFNDLSAADQAELLQKRLGDYCRKVYKKIRENSVVSRESIICQRENSFYVDTVRSFRDRRYEYKGLHKVWKGKCDAAKDAAAMDEAKKMIVLYDSLQLAHKCILNSFYGYVMRKGSRWYSMEMAGIVCLTGATLIQMARQLVEQIGRPLELDTDGIWCILPASFPENFYFTLKNGKKLPISYPCVMLNHLVHAQFTNHQYHELIPGSDREYQARSENSIFFEVDGPYRAMILPASTAADKLLKKRYAVFNHDGSLAELKGFEVKRRGELKLIKIFQSQIFQVFLDGSTLAECYAAVARLADQWLDILYSKGSSLHDSELFELISENRSMSKSLAEYGDQKSTSISTARRLAEFLGDQVVKDKGLACRFIISNRPLGLPVSERAIPITIFSAEPPVKKHFLRKWLRDPGLTNFDIRTIIDWSYYMERFGSVIQKLITIPAAMQKIANPVPRVKHPDWLAKRVAVLNDKRKQHKISDMFTLTEITEPDLEDFGRPTAHLAGVVSRPVVVSRKRARSHTIDVARPPLDLSGLPPYESVPKPEKNYVAWLKYQKLKWRRMAERRTVMRARRSHGAGGGGGGIGGSGERNGSASSPWQIMQILPTESPGVLKAWILAGSALHAVYIDVPRVFFVNSRVTNPVAADSTYVTPVHNWTLPRSQPCLHCYQFTMPEPVYQQHIKSFQALFSHPDIIGVYETQIEPVYRFLLTVGSSTSSSSSAFPGPSISTSGGAAAAHPDTSFHVDHLLHSIGVTRTNHQHYLDARQTTLNFLYLFHSTVDTRSIFGLFSPALGLTEIFVMEGVQGRLHLPNLETPYAERLAASQLPTDAQQLAQANVANATDGFAFAYPKTLRFAQHLCKSEAQIHKAVNTQLGKWLAESRLPTVVVLHSAWTAPQLAAVCPALHDAPYLTMPYHKNDRQLPALDWQRYAARRMLGHFLNVSQWVQERIALARYSDTPVGNIEADPALFLADLFFARKLANQNVVLWWSPTRKPDLGGREADEHTWLTEEMAHLEISHPGLYPTVCVEIEVGNLAINTVLQAPLINELEGAAGVRNSDEAVEVTPSGPAPGTVASLGALSDGAISPHVFNLLRAMVRSWYTEVAHHHGPPAASPGHHYAEIMTQHFYHWLTHPGSRLYDPCLYAMVQGLIRKVFLQMLAEMRRLGARIVSANASKIIIATSKTTRSSAAAYTQYLLRTVTRLPLFDQIDLNPVEVWDRLIWMDGANFGGVLSIPAPINVEEDPKIEMSWNIREYLPPALHGDFDLVLAEFIYALHDHHRSNSSTEPTDTTPLTSVPDETAGELDEDGTDQRPKEDPAFARKFISQTLTRKLLRLIPDIQARCSTVPRPTPIGSESTTPITRDPSAPSEWSIRFPILPGSYAQFTNPALEFVKSICAVLDLVAGAQRDVRILKRNSLDLLGVREFSTEAVFHNPSQTLKLHQVICEYCNYCRDLDFCRDLDLLPSRPWLCLGCRHEYDRTTVELALVNLLLRRLQAFQLQDLKCTKCHMVKAENLLPHCASCSAPFALAKTTQVEFMRQLQVFRNVARFHKLTLLADTVNWVLRTEVAT
ncbi:DNA polymerase epsilon catalytic subunit A [Dimargaris cristalligena]|uniref:DNA polymerase epsilon catalytic subunit n=1 Tax=Dimargaris cristalligena TaxID=215637 RepID=A0A4Q0A1G7_9FUNG|nr:DNA polymerase epsilon catalytic subunit A [Dimargaris cristalligena]|eukprot:RKP39877.1 DNA polymerase epsilon catalytic subunit A [Dimargaris cristalligena]